MLSVTNDPLLQFKTKQCQPNWRYYFLHIYSILCLIFIAVIWIDQLISHLDFIHFSHSLNCLLFMIVQIKTCRNWQMHGFIMSSHMCSSLAILNKKLSLWLHLYGEDQSKTLTKVLVKMPEALLSTSPSFKHHIVDAASAFSVPCDL